MLGGEALETTRWLRAVYSETVCSKLATLPPASYRVIIPEWCTTIRALPGRNNTFRFGTNGVHVLFVARFAHGSVFAHPLSALRALGNLRHVCGSPFLLQYRIILLGNKTFYLFTYKRLNISL
jgi:hypothetical protein